jgi:hypothetical protein
MIDKLQTNSSSDTNDVWDFSPVLLKLLKMENNRLSSAVMHLIVRLQRGQRVELLTSISQVKFFFKIPDLTNHERIVKNLDILRKLTAQYMSQTEMEEVVKILQNFIALCFGE